MATIIDTRSILATSITYTTHTHTHTHMMRNGLTAIVIFPIMLTGILPKLRMRSKLPPSCKLGMNKFHLAYIKSVARQRQLPMPPPVVKVVSVQLPLP